MDHAAQQDAIRDRAYHKWLEAGAPEGDGAEFWLEAESELLGSSTEPSNRSASGTKRSQRAGGVTTSGVRPIPDKEQVVGTRG